MCPMLPGCRASNLRVQQSAPGCARQVASTKSQQCKVMHKGAEVDQCPLLDLANEWYTGRLSEDCVPADAHGDMRKS